MCLAQETDADALLARDPFALLTGMLLDQQIPMERAFAGPHTIARRLGDDGLDVRRIAAYDPEAFAALLAEKPAVHRFPGSMAGRVQKLAQFLVENYDGDTEALWNDAPTGKDLLKRLSALPGFGRQKAQIFLALLGKQRGVRPEGWREAAGAYGDDEARRSVADVVDAETLGEVRAYKQQVKRAAKTAG
jgi:uncharacterized HhH-GPD family protein